METLRTLNQFSRVRNRPSVQKDATGRLSRGYRAHLSLLERELAQLQTDVPEWANPQNEEANRNSNNELINENGVKMTKKEIEEYNIEKNQVWKDYRTKCSSLAQDTIDTEHLLELFEETWSSRITRSGQEYRALCKWLKLKKALPALQISAFNSNGGGVEGGPKPVGGRPPRLVSLHSDRSVIGAQLICIEQDGSKITLGLPTCDGMGVTKSSCQISRDDCVLENDEKEEEKNEENNQKKVQSEDEKDETTLVPIPTGLTVHVSPRAFIYINGKQILPNTSCALFENDILVIGVHRMYRVEGARNRNSNKRKNIHAEKSWYDGARQLNFEAIQKLLLVEEKIVEKAKNDYEETERRIEELQAQISVEKRKVKQSETKKRRAKKKAEKSAIHVMGEEKIHQKEVDALQKRVDTLEATLKIRASESSSLQARVAQAERGSRVLLPMLLKDLMALRALTNHINPCLNKNKYVFVPRLVPNHAKVSKMSLHHADDHLMHGSADVELWVEVTSGSVGKDEQASPKGKNSGRRNRNRRRSPSRDKEEETTTTVMWNRDRFMLRYHLMREMYNVWRLANNGGSNNSSSDAINTVYNKDNDPYVLGSTSGHQIIGQSHMYLDSLSYFIEFEEVVAVIDFRGKEVGRMRVQVTPLSLAGVELMLDEIDEQQTKSLRDYIGERYIFVINIVACRNLPSESCSNVYVAMQLPELEGHKEQNNAEAPQHMQYFETPKHAHDTIHPTFDVPMTVDLVITEHMCNALSTDMVEFTLRGSKPGSGHSIESHDHPDFINSLKKKDPLSFELKETKTELNRLSMSLSTTKLEMEEAKLEAKEKQERAEQLKNELNMMRKGTAAEKYRIEATTLKEQLGTATDELIATKASLKKLEMKLKKSKTCNIQ